MRHLLTLCLLLILTLQVNGARVTAYCPSEDHTNGSKSCTGARLHDGDIAADLDYYSIGQAITIDGKRYRVADCGGAVQGRNHFDVFCSSRAKMNDFVASHPDHMEVEIGDRPLIAYSSKRAICSTPKPRNNAFICYSSKRGYISIV